MAAFRWLALLARHHERQQAEGLPDNGLEPAATRQIVCGVLAAVTHSHASGFVHRDLKPENITWRITGPAADGTSRYSIKVIDWGLCAKVTPQNERLRELCGSPGIFAPQTSSTPGARASSERMERAAEADPSEPNDGTEQRGADPQPPVLSQQQLEICQLHAAMWQREMLTAGFKLRVDAAFIRAAKVTFRAVDAYRQVGFDMAGRIPAAIRQQGTAAVDAYLARRWQPGAFIPARARLAWL